MAQRNKKRSRSTLPLLPSLLSDEPPSAQHLSQRVMRAEWIDPGDDNPNRRTARMVAGFRARCPLRRCIARFGARAGYTPEMIEAADRLRSAYDGMRLGFNGLVLDGRPINEVKLYLPPSGPTRPALRQLKCRQTFERAWSLFDEDARAMLMLVVLRNMPMTRYAELAGIRAETAKERMLQALDRLVDWFDIEPVRGTA
jgi:hypothetical protein